jgi:hypothetical protein
MKWRDDQRLLMPKAGDAVARQRSCEVEHEKLFLPSDFEHEEQQTVEAIALGIEEAKLREGEAYDALRAIQSAVKTLTAIQDRKRKNARGQAENTKSGSYIRDAQSRRDHHMETYASARLALILLGVVDSNDPESPFPPLTIEDTFMKSRQRGRGLGDSRRTDGKLWQMHGQIASMGDLTLHGVHADSQVSNQGEMELLPSECCRCHRFLLGIAHTSYLFQLVGHK